MINDLLKKQKEAVATASFVSILLFWHHKRRDNVCK